MAIVQDPNKMLRMEMLRALAEDVAMYSRALKEAGMPENERGFVLAQFQAHGYDAVSFRLDMNEKGSDKGGPPDKKESVS